MRRINHRGQPSIAGNSIYYGIKTGYNDAFIVSTAVRDRLIAEDPSSQGILKPILRGRDIARYRANWRDLWLIASFPSLNLDINDYPSVKKYLLGFGKQRLVQKGILLPDGNRSRKHTPHHWYELQDTCAYHETFNHEKLFWMDLTEEGRFSYEPELIYCTNTVYMISGQDIKYLCAVLNSSLITWFMKTTAATSGMGVTRWFKVYVEKIPIPIPSDSVRLKITNVVDRILEIRSSGLSTDIEMEEEEIDRIICFLYGLNRKELMDVIYPN